MIDHIFSVLENGENGLDDEGANGGGNAPRIFELEPPLATIMK